MSSDGAVRRTPRAELHELEVCVMCGATDSTGAEWLAELMSIVRVAPPVT
jgi:hypothetical protein